MTPGQPAPVHATMPDSKPAFFPKEHGATAMLLSPFVSAAILVREFRWTELAALVAVVFAFAAKDPLTVLARQRFVWKQPHPETAVAKRWLAVELPVIAVCGAVLMILASPVGFALLGAGEAAFGAFAIWMTVKNRQRSEWLQVASAISLTASSLAVCLTVLSRVPPWGWLLWLLCAMQAVAGIFVVHARLDARIASRKVPATTSVGGGQMRSPEPSRRAAAIAITVLAISAAAFLLYRLYWISSALAIAACAYHWELRRQRDPESLKTPLTRIGQQALTLAVAYGALVIIGLWRAG